MQGLRPDLKLSWEEVLEQFDNLIKFAARQQIESGSTRDNSISAEDLYQEGITKLFDCWMKWCVGENKDIDEFGPIFRKSLFRKVKQYGSRGTMTVDLEDAANIIEDTNAEDTVHRMYMEEGLAHLSSMLSSDIARSILSELHDPSERTLYEVLADIRRKEMLKSQGKKVNVPKDNTIRMKHIVRSLGITGKQYDIAMQDIRAHAPLVF